jgi:hypothetical protein
MAVAAGIDRILGWLKWPTALASLLLLPGLLRALVQVVRAIERDPEPTYAFLGGAIGFAILWRLLRRAWLGRYLLVLEHELTHALFAWATFHRVYELHATARSGGHVRYQGPGNWLIVIAPYFVPTASLIALAVLAWLPERLLVHGSAALGATVAFHVASTLAETHRDQPDLRTVGWLFSALFLPASNIAVLSVLLAFAAGLPPLAHLAGVPHGSRAFLEAVVLRVSG